MSDDYVQPGEYEVRNRYGDVVQRGEAITVEIPDGVEWLMNPPANLRNGDSFTSITSVQLEDE